MSLITQAKVEKRRERTIYRKLIVIKKTKIKVKERALLGRVNRVLAKEGLRLHKSRSIQCFLDCGEWYITDGRNLISEKNIKLEKMGRGLKVLKPYVELENTV